MSGPLLLDHNVPYHEWYWATSSSTEDNSRPNVCIVEGFDCPTSDPHIKSYRDDEGQFRPGIADGNNQSWSLICRLYAASRPWQESSWYEAAAADGG